MLQIGQRLDVPLETGMMAEIERVNAPESGEWYRLQHPGKKVWTDGGRVRFKLRRGGSSVAIGQLVCDDQIFDDEVERIIKRALPRLS
jgi:hypothetical protein